MSNSTSTTSERLVALRMMQDRGIDDAESLFQHASPSTIIYRLKEYDRDKAANPTRIHKGLVVWKIINKGDNVEERVAKPKVPVYSEDALPLPFMAHDAWLKKRGYPQECPDGTLIAIAARYPVVEIECDKCGSFMGLSHKRLGECPAIENAVLGG